MKLAVTGDHEDLPEVKLRDGSSVEWIGLPVLQFERLPIAETILKGMTQKPYDWILFSSPRAVQFWSETILEEEIDFPIETQIACIGESTAAAASQDGFNPDFFPTEPGTEMFLLEFKDLLSNNTQKPRILIPSAEQGRTTLAEELIKLGCQVDRVPLYRTSARADFADWLSKNSLEGIENFLITSPSSFDALNASWNLKGKRLIALGQYTADYLHQKTGGTFSLLPEGSFEKIAEVL